MAFTSCLLLSWTRGMLHVNHQMSQDCEILWLTDTWSKNRSRGNRLYLMLELIVCDFSFNRLDALQTNEQEFS